MRLITAQISATSFYVLYRNEVGVNVAEIKIWCIVIDVLQLVLYNVCGTAVILEVSFEL